ncbi:hypothetical protein PLICRDRAFT_169561 [Plicaturopsis crispa FD-325 SS-3]|nr:hypothetical protein PLICRDRAFT_169561 [Plicaturopsis crispa FD-325 SS-3]
MSFLRGRTTTPGPVRSRSTLPGHSSTPYAVPSRPQSRHEYPQSQENYAENGSGPNSPLTGSPVFNRDNQLYRTYSLPSAQSSSSSLHSGPQVSPPVAFTGHSAPQNIDYLINQYPSSIDRRAVYHFVDATSDEKLIILYMETLNQRDETAKIAKQVNAVQGKLDRLEQFAAPAWKLTKVQEDLIKSLIRHYLIKGITTYKTTTKLVQNYIKDNANTLRLGLYKTDPTVRKTINDYVQTQQNNLKSAFRKTLSGSVEDGKEIPLKIFARRMVDYYWLPKVPANVPDSTMASLAMLRDIARPFVEAKARAEAAKRANTAAGTSSSSNAGTVTIDGNRFWDFVEKTLANNHKKFGTNHDSEEWKAWEADMIAQDMARFSQRSAEQSALTREEIDTAMGFREAEDTDNEIEEPDHAAETAETADGEIDVRLMDLAQTIPLYV